MYFRTRSLKIMMVLLKLIFVCFCIVPTGTQCMYHERFTCIILNSEMKVYLYNHKIKKSVLFQKEKKYQKHFDENLCLSSVNLLSGSNLLQFMEFPIKFTVIRAVSTISDCVTREFVKLSETGSLKGQQHEIFCLGFFHESLVLGV